ncbi:MAG TPA: GHKL domain-containing protein [Pseudobacteroides sp.]|uniref:sensor histidine kinase n=1 Tax=Pseudobacteroides sp. TaxID=1968840 RepID=UPI002F943D4A
MQIVTITIIFETLAFLIVSLFFKYLKGKQLSSIYIFTSLLYGLSSTSASWLVDYFIPDFAMVKPLICLILQVVLISFTVKLPYSTSFKYLVPLDLLFGLSNVITLAIFALLRLPTNMDELSKNLIYMVFGQLINTALSVLIVYSIYRNHKHIRTITARLKKQPLGIMLFTFLMLSANLSIYFIILKKYSISVWFIISITFIVCAYFIIILILTKKFYYYSLKENELVQQQFYNNILNNTLHVLRRYKHDFNNNISVMHLMLLSKRYKELEEYMNEVTKFSTSTNTDLKMLDIHNAALNGLISSKIKCAEQMGVHIELQILGQITDIKNIKMMDLCEMLGIVLDNAIEASEKDETITILLEQTDRFTRFKVINNFDGDFDLFNLIRSGNYSSKGGEHGNGLKIVKSIVKEYKNLDYNMTYNPDLKTIATEIVNTNL